MRSNRVAAFVSLVFWGRVGKRCRRADIGASQQGKNAACRHLAGWHVKDAASWHLSAQARGKTLRKTDNFAEDWMIK